jgi:hypothetical protein
MEKISMPRKSFDADDPRRWMVYAKSDLKLAREGRRIPGYLQNRKAQGEGGKTEANKDQKSG